MLSCLQIGLSISDIDKLSLGQIIDLIICFNNLNDSSSNVKKATQDDFDKF